MGFEFFKRTTRAVESPSSVRTPEEIARDSERIQLAKEKQAVETGLRKRISVSSESTGVPRAEVQRELKETLRALNMTPSQAFENFKLVSERMKQYVKDRGATWKQIKDELEVLIDEEQKENAA